MDRAVLNGVLAAEVALLAAGIVLLLAHATWRRARRAWIGPRIVAARQALTQALAGNPTAKALPRLPLEASVQLWSQATRSVDVSTRNKLASFPAHADLAAHGKRWCRSRRWTRRVKGARLLTILGVGGQVMADLLTDPRAEVRAEAAAWVAQHPTPSGVARLVEMLADQAVTCRLVAQSSLIRLQSAALEPLVEHLSQPAPAALAAALGVAAVLADPKLLAPALSHRTHTDPAVRAADARVLSAVGGDAAVHAVQDYLTDPDPAVRAAAADGLAALGHWPSAPHLAEALGDPAWVVRRAAGLALRGLGAPGHLYLRRSLQALDPFAADMARQTLDLPGRLAGSLGA